MTNAIAELRDLNLELESLKARKNAIKTLNELFNKEV